MDKETIITKQSGRGIYLLLAGLAALAMLSFVAVAPHAAAAPLRQTFPQQQSGKDPNADYVSQYLANKGYEVLGVGYVADKSNPKSTANVAAVMNFASTKYDPTAGLPTDDQDTVTQAVVGFYALHKYYPKSTLLIVGLVYQDSYTFVFPTTATDFQAVLDDNNKADAFWQNVTSNFIILDSQGNEVDPNSFTSKNFGDKNFTGQNNGPTPPPNDSTNPTDPASSHTPGAGYLRLLTSSAYLPVGSKDFYALGLVSDKDYNVASGQKVRFTLKAKGQDDQPLGDPITTDNDGIARQQISSVKGSGDVAISAQCAASNDPASCGDVTIDGPASTVVLVGPDNLGTEQGKTALNQAMTDQGYSVEEVDYQESNDVTGKTNAAAVLVMDMASKRYDQTLRTQMFSAFGTEFVIFPKVTNGILGLFYQQSGKGYILVYELNRTDWEAFSKGSISEPTFWSRVALNRVIDAKTGQDINGGKDFVNKNFTGTDSNTGAARIRTVESTLTVEDWGVQPNDDNINVPLGGYADSFQVLKLEGNGKAWSIFSVEDTSKPVYSSKDDTNGAKLKSLTLANGNYILMVEDPDPPSGTTKGTVAERVQVQYTEHLP